MTTEKERISATGAKIYPFVTYCEETSLTHIDFSETVHVTLNKKDTRDLHALLEMIALGR